jgi:hypothetical protein
LIDFLKGSFMAKKTKTYSTTEIDEVLIIDSRADLTSAIEKGYTAVITLNDNLHKLAEKIKDNNPNAQMPQIISVKDINKLSNISPEQKKQIKETYKFLQRANKKQSAKSNFDDDTEFAF